MTHTKEAMQAQARLYSREGKLFPAGDYPTMQHPAMGMGFGGEGYAGAPGFGGPGAYPGAYPGYPGLRSGGFESADKDGDGVVDGQEFANASIRSLGGGFAPPGPGYAAYRAEAAPHAFGGFGHPSGYPGMHGGQPGMAWGPGQLPTPVSGIYKPSMQHFPGHHGPMAAAAAAAAAAKADKEARENAASGAASKSDTLMHGDGREFMDAYHQGSLPGSLLAFGGPGYGAPVPYSAGYGITYPGAAMPGAYAQPAANPFSNSLVSADANGDGVADGLPGYGTMANGPFGGAHIGAYGPGHFAGMQFSGYQGLGPYGSKAAYPYQYQGGGVHPVSGRPLAPSANRPPEFAVKQNETGQQY